MRKRKLEETQREGESDAENEGVRVDEWTVYT
jgi:hypothetical protein